MKTPKTTPARAVFSEARLGLLDDILITAGWTQQNDGWVPPESQRRAIELSNGRGEWSRDNAIRLMTLADQYAVRAAAR